MIKLVKRTSLQVGAAFIAGMMMSGQAHAGNNFSSIGENITLSIESLPGLLTALSYMFGILLGVLGIIKIKDHVENPGNAPLKDGAIRLAAGGALLALPIVFEAMMETIGNDQNAPATAKVNKVEFGTN